MSPLANFWEGLQSRLGNEKIISSLKPGVFNEGFFGLTMLAEHVIPLKSEMENIFVYDRRDETRPLVITARMGMLKNNLDKGILTLRLSEGAIHTESADDETIQQKINFDVYDINLDVGFSPEGWAHLSPPSYTYPQLMERIHQTVLDPPEHRIFLVELHRRVSMAFSCTVFAALGFFIGILSHRGMRGQVVVICLLVTLGYWLSYLFLNAYVLAGSLAPWFGIWLPNFMFLGVAYNCYRRYVGG
jgi:lipopolysaccharide export system permease protein